MQITPSEKIRIGLIGFGLSGRVFHATLLKALPEYEIVKVYTSRPQELATELPNAKAVTNVDEIFQDPNIDLVINTAPNAFHYTYSAAALEAGKHVVVEKPFVNTAAEGQKLLSLAIKNKKVLTVFQNRRWDADFLTVKKLIESGRLGEIRVFESHFDRLRPVPRLDKWREQIGPGTGIFYDIGSHLLDQALVLFGKPDDMHADIEIQRPNAVVDDYFHVILKYKNMRVILHSSSFTDQSPRFYIQGAQASFMKFGLDPQEDALRRGENPTHPNFGQEDKTQYGTLTTWVDSKKKTEIIPSEIGDYAAFYRNLYLHLKGESKHPPVDPAQSLEVIRWIESAHASAKKLNR